MSLSPLIRQRVVPVLRLPDADLAATAVTWLSEAGLTCLELTMTTPGALDLLRDLSKREDLTLGMGTLRSAAEAEAAVAAGAKFLVSPALLAMPAGQVSALGVPFVMGATTPSEILAAHAAGAAAVKIFPVSNLGGTSYVRAIRAVFPEIPLMPSGGIGIPDIGPYLEAGCAAVGVGGVLGDARAVAQGDRERIRRAATEAQAAVSAAQIPAP